ncbi:replicative DNA helicase [Candidatus Pacearchaeota archaeon]|jgi:replicative DNA helicase|nr:replicative DNA helicase [Candidatus Pacearchaeota archaeon]
MPEQLTPPHDRQAEVSLLGSLLIDNSYTDNVAEKITDDCFYDKRHRIVWQAIKELAIENTPQDLVTVTDRLIAKQQLDGIGGRAYLIELTDDVYSAANCERYAEIIREKYLLRLLMNMARTTYDKASRQDGTPAELVAAIELELLKTANLEQAAEILTFQDAGLLFLKRLDEVYEARNHPEIMKTWITTGLYDLDKLIFRLEPGTVTLLAGAPGDGKTSLSIGICDDLDQRGVPTGFVSLEMKDEELVGRFMCRKTGIDHDALRRGTLSDYQYEQVCRFNFTDSKIVEKYFTGGSPLAVRSTIRRMVRQYGIKLAVVDYVQKMNLNVGDVGNRNEELSKVSAIITDTAKECAIPIILPSQMNKQFVQRADKRPILTDIRDCGSLAADAHNVFFIWHPYRHGQGEQNVAEIVVAKQRSGPVGIAQVYWDAARASFRSSDRSRHE